MKELGSLGVRVMVDEVYLDAAFEQKPGSAGLLGDQFIVTSSLTKVYGLSGLRCGWILAEPALAEQMWQINDKFGNIPAHMAELASVIAIGELPRIAGKCSGARLDRNRHRRCGNFSIACSRPRSFSTAFRYRSCFRDSSAGVSTRCAIY